MSKVLVIYASVHHQNTKKLLEGAKETNDFDMVSVTESADINPGAYDVIGFASGIYMSKPHEKIALFMNEHINELKTKKVFFVFTSGAENKKLILQLTEQLQEQGVMVEGAYRCKGFDTFGPFRLVGGINKGHPNEKDVEDLGEFMMSMADR